MATEQLLLSAVVSGSDNWSLAAGSNKVAACQTPDDNGTSYISSGTTANTVQRFSLADPVNIGAGDTINHVTVRIRHMRAGTPAGNIQSSLTVGANTTFGTLVGTGASWADQSIQYDNVPGGSGWTLANLNDLIAGVRNGQTRSVFCTTIEVVADYTPAAAPIVGNLSVTLDNDTLSASGDVAVVGTLSAQLDDDTLSASGTVSGDLPEITGTLEVTLDSDTLSSGGSVAVSGVLSAQLDGDTLASSGAVTIGGALSVNLDDDALSSAGVVTISGVLGAQLDSDTLSATGTVSSGPPDIIGTLNVQLDDDTLSSSGTVSISGILSSTLDDNTLTSAGVVSISGVLTQTLDGDTLSSSGAVSISAILDVQLAGDALSASGTVGEGLPEIIGVLDVQLDDDTLFSTGKVSKGRGVYMRNVRAILPPRTVKPEKLPVGIERQVAVLRER